MRIVAALVLVAAPVYAQAAGTDTDAVLNEFGFSANEIATLNRDGVVGKPG